MDSVGTAIGVLLIEDNPGDARLIQEYLVEDDRLQFRVAAEDRLATAVLRLAEDSFEVVLLDLGLPDSTGLETYYSLKRQFPGLPVVVLSGLDDADTALRAVRGGAQDYLVKGSIDSAILSRSIRYAIERTRVDAALQRQTNTLSAVMRSIDDGIVVTDSDGNCLMANDKAKELLQTRDAIVNVSEWRPAYGLVRSRDLLAQSPEINPYDALKHRAHVADMGFEMESRNPGEGTRYMRVSISPLKAGDRTDLRGSVLVMRDVTTRYREELEHLRRVTALEQTANPVIITGPDGAIEYVNKAFQILMGYRRNEVIGANPRLLKSGRTESSVYEELWQTIARGEVWHGRLINKAKNGKLVEVDTTISPVRNATGDIVNFVATQRDVTTEVELENQLRHLQRMEAFGQLTSGIAHDFNNLLTAICGYTEIVLNELPEGHALRDDVERIESAGRSAANLTRQLLAFSRQQVLQPRVQDLKAIVEDMQRMFKRIVPEHIELITLHGADLYPIWADQSQLEQVIMNLIVNACDAMPDGGTLRIRTENALFDQSYVDRHFDAAEGDYVMLAISDSGLGMSAEVQERIFEPFYTTKDVGKGTGLGLATVYGIVKQSGGVIWVYSEPGYGTTFKLYFPRAGSQEEDAAAEETPVARESYHGNEMILVVEDNDSVRQYVVRALVSNGYGVLECSNGAEALAVLEEHASEVDLILSDIVMPVMSGPDFVNRLQPNHYSYPIVYMSGYFEQSLYINVVRSNAQGFLEKPFTTHELLGKIRRVLDA